MTENDRARLQAAIADGLDAVRWRRPGPGGEPGRRQALQRLRARGHESPKRSLAALRKGRRESQRLYSKKVLTKARGGDEGGPYTKQKSGYSHLGDPFPGEKSPAVEEHLFLKKNPQWRRGGTGGGKIR